MINNDIYIINFIYIYIYTQYLIMEFLLLPNNTAKILSPPLPTVCDVIEDFHISNLEFWGNIFLVILTFRAGVSWKDQYRFSYPSVKYGSKAICEEMEDGNGALEEQVGRFYYPWTEPGWLCFQSFCQAKLTWFRFIFSVQTRGYSPKCWTSF